MTEQDIQAVLGTHYGCGCRVIHGSMNIIVPNVLMYTANGMYEADFTHFLSNLIYNSG